MIIVIAGNIASGKSTLANYMADKLNIPIIGIDKYRSHCRAEYESRQAMLQDIKLYPSLIYETTTANLVHPSVLGELQKKGTPIFTILVLCSPETCLERYRQRPIDLNNLPHFDTQTSINHIDRYLRRVSADFIYPSEQTTPENFYSSFKEKLDSRLSIDNL